MLTQSIEVMKYIRASAGRAGISVVFESVNKPRHDGKTIYLPRITFTTTDAELRDLMASVDHEVAHDRYSSFDVLKEKEVDSKSLLMFMWNFLEDSRINNIEACEYRGFRENWDECGAILTEKIFSRAKKDSSILSDLTTALIYWEARICAANFPKIDLVASKVRPNKKILDVLNNYTSRLVASYSVLPKRLGTETTYELAKDILKELGHEFKEEFDKLAKAKSPGSAGDGEGTESGKASEDDPTADSSKSTGGEVTKEKDDEYKIINIKLTEEDLAKFSVSMHNEDSEMGKVGVNFDPVSSKEDIWDMTDYDKFIVVDYPRKIGLDKYLVTNSSTRNFLTSYVVRAEEKLVATDNFANQVRRLIQIRAKVQRQYGVKKGKLDQSRLSRICFDAPGFNERVFKNKIENKTLDAAITVLVDMSGSMEGDKAYFALASTLLVNEVCSVLNIPVEIVGFSDDYNPSYLSSYVPTMFIYKNFGDKRIADEQLKEYFSMSSPHMHGNPDGENIVWAYERLIKRKEKKKLLIVMSDGSPAASKSSIGLSEFTQKVINEIEASKVVDIYGLGLCSNSVDYYYNASSVVNKPEEIPNKLLELIERKVLA
jgi:Cobalamin biosynthesis protein CobT VWA domain